LLRTLRNRDLLLPICGQAVSQVGDGIFGVALAWRVYQSYSSPAALSVVGIAFFVPRLLVTIAGGVLSDRFERRWTMVAVKFELHASAAALGIVYTAGGLGTVAAGLLMGRLSRPRHVVVAMVLGCPVFP